MAEAIAVLGLVSTIISLVEVGQRVIQCLDDFKKNTKELPNSFRHIGHQLPLVILTVNRLQDRVQSGNVDTHSIISLSSVLQDLRDDVDKLENIFRRVMPSDGASKWEVSIKAIKSVAVQKDVQTLATQIQSNVNVVTCYDTTRNTDLLLSLIDSIKKDALPKPTWELQYETLLFMVNFDSDAHFVGRDSITTTLDKRFQEQKRVSLGGIGGVGKSRIAIEYCYRRKDLEHVFWVYSASRAKFESSYQSIADKLELKGQDNRTDGILGQIRDWLDNEKNGPWFMVVDNADDQHIWIRPPMTTSSTEKQVLQPLIDYLPRARHGRILFTTRDSQLGDMLTEGTNKTINVLRLDPLEARTLLRSKLPSAAQPSDEEADELSRALEYLPLAINQAAAYLEAIQIPATDYLALLRAHESDIPELLEESIDDPIRDRAASNSVFKTWKISYEQILRQDQRAADFLSLMAVIDRQAISQDLLRSLGGSPLQFRAALAKLKAFSLIEEHKDLHVFSMHRLVHVSTRRWLSSRGQLSKWEEMALMVISSGLPSSADYENWLCIRQIYLHAQVVLDYKTDNLISLGHRADILHVTGHYAIHQGQPSLALDSLREASSIRTRILGNDHELTLVTKSLYGVALSQLRRVAESQTIQAEVYRSALRSLGTGHPLTLKCMSRTAITYNLKNDPKASLNRQRDVLALMKKKLGSEHPDTLVEMGNLTFTLMKLKEFRAPEELAIETLTLRSRVLGTWHPDTLTAMVNLAWSHNRQEHWYEAEQLYAQAIEMRKLVLGDKHPKTVQTMQHLARIYFIQNRTEDARELEKEVAEITRRHPEALSQTKGSVSNNFLNPERLPERPRARSTGGARDSVNKMPITDTRRARSNDRRV